MSQTPFSASGISPAPYDSPFPAAGRAASSSPLNVARRDTAYATYRRNALRPLLTIGAASFVAWLAVYLLFFTRTLWDSPALIADRWPAFFYRIQQALPWDWVVADHDSPAGLRNRLIGIALVAVLGALWLGACRTALRLPAAGERLRRAGLLVALGGAALFSALIMLTLGLTSGDVFSYIFYGKIAAVYQGNPFT